MVTLPLHKLLRHWFRSLVINCGFIVSAITDIAIWLLATLVFIGKFWCCNVGGLTYTGRYCFGSGA